MAHYKYDIVRLINELSFSGKKKTFEIKMKFRDPMYCIVVSSEPKKRYFTKRFPAKCSAKCIGSSVSAYSVISPKSDIPFFTGTTGLNRHNHHFHLDGLNQNIYTTSPTTIVNGFTTNYYINNLMPYVLR